MHRETKEFVWIKIFTSLWWSGTELIIFLLRSYDIYDLRNQGNQKLNLENSEKGWEVHIYSKALSLQSLYFPKIDIF